MHSSVRDRRGRIADIAAKRGFDSLLLSSPAGVGYVTDIDIRPFVDPVIARVSADGRLSVTASDNDGEILRDAVPDAELSLWSAEPGAPIGAATAAWNRTGLTAAEGPAFAGVAPPEARQAGREILDEAGRVRFVDEIAQLRDAGRLAEIAYTATVDRMHPELRAFEIARNVERSLRAAGGGGSWSLDESDDGLSTVTSFPPGLVGLLDRRPETGVLDVGVPLPFQLLPLSGAYGVASATTAVLSPPSDDLRARADALGRAIAAAIDALTAGAEGASVDAAFRAIAPPEDTTFVGFSVGTGPGGVVIRRGAGGTIDAGSALSLRATTRSRADAPRVVFQTTVLVTDSGAERLDPVIPLRLIELY